MDLKSQEMSQLRESFGAACLVCTSPLAEPFQDSEILINRNVSLLEAFCEYMDVQGDCEVVAKEFPFCGLCKITLVELKALHTEVQAMFTRIFSIKLKLTAEIMESQNTHMNKGTDFCNPRSVRFTNDRGIHFEFGSQPEISTLENIKFSKSVYKCVTAWRNSIFRRFDVAVTVIPPKKQLSGASVSPYEGAVIEPECSDSQLANCGDGMDNYSGNEVSDLEGETEEIKENLDRELTPPIDDSDIAPPIVTAGSREMESIITSTEHEIDLLTLTTKRKSDNFIAVSHSEVSKQLNHGEDLSRDHVSVCDDTELTDKDYSEDSVPDSDSDDWAEPKKLRSKNFVQFRTTQSDKKNEVVRNNSITSGRYIELSPGMFRYADKFNFELKEGTYLCSLCGYRTNIHCRILKHLRIHNRSTTGRMRRRLIKTAPTKWLYGNKYEIENIDDRFICTLCSFNRKSKYKLIDHIKRVHINNLPPKPPKNIDNGTTAVAPVKKTSFHPSKFSRYKEVSPGKFLFDDKFPFETDGLVFRCGGEYCFGRTFPDLLRVTTHLRKFHCSNKNVIRRNLRLSEIEPNKFVYGGKYNVNLVDGKYVCSLCGFSRKVKSKTIAHIRNIHMSIVTTKSRSSRYVSMNQEVSPGHWLYKNRYPFKKTYHGFSCGSCLEKCPDFHQILYHVRKFHFKHAAESYICDVCGKVFTRRDSFNSHKYIHKPDRPTYVCHVCGKSFKRKRNLTKHLELHDPTFSCEFCEAKFPSDFKLRSHRFIHTGEKPFKCKHCPEEFRTRKGLCRHSMYRHGKRVGGTTNETNENDDDNEEQLPSFILKVEHDTADDDQHDDKFHAGGLTNDAGNTEEGVTSVVVEQIKFG